MRELRRGLISKRLRANTRLPRKDWGDIWDGLNQTRCPSFTSNASACGLDNSQVLQSEYGYVILKLHERETAKSRGDTARDRIVEEALMYERRRELLIEELERLKERYPIERRPMPGADAQ